MDIESFYPLRTDRNTEYQDPSRVSRAWGTARWAAPRALAPTGDEVRFLTRRLATLSNE
jgi:hypothetical protein